MRKILFLGLWAWLAMAMAGCSDNKCHIHGTIPDNYDGKRIFLVPLTDSRAEVVDSIEVKDGKFEFVSDTLMMAKIIVDYHYRMGLQTLLVAVEPGHLHVTIDSVSHASGTPLNDSLENWKNSKEAHDLQMQSLRKLAAEAASSNDNVKANALKAQADSFHLAFKKYTRTMAGNLPGGPLHDFLANLYPLTYKRLMPDSTTVVFDADTHEPINK